MLICTSPPCFQGIFSGIISLDPCESPGGQATLSIYTHIFFLGEATLG